MVENHQPPQESKELEDGEAVIFKVGQLATVQIACPLHGDVIVKVLVGWKGLVVDKVQCPFVHPKTDENIDIKVTIYK